MFYFHLARPLQTSAQSKEKDEQGLLDSLDLEAYAEAGVDGITQPW